ncbi:hypothetical protein V5O48_008780 [Marasmius crinis-equi]|uniref:F-box domain-containing protein n=1 Tax=Marasmius crinis-equi TaxID=585013 RepID=A0ABR3FCY2_9AGAR
MHQALTISEILRSIFQWCDKPSNVSNAVVCKSWQNDGLGLVWEEITNINHIFRSLGPASWDGHHQYFDPPLTRQRWDLFQERYAWRVRSLFCGHLQREEYALLDTVARFARSAPVFSSLQSLTWGAGISSWAGGYSHPSITFMHPNVESFKLIMTDHVPTDLLEQYLWAVSEYMPKLRSLDVTATESSYDALTEVSMTLGEKFAELESLYLPSTPNISTVLKGFASSSTALKRLHFSKHPDGVEVTRMDPLVDSSALQNLQDLSLHIPYQTFTHFIRQSQDPLPRLTRLTVWSAQEESPSAVKDLLEVVAQRFVKMEIVKALFSPRSSRSPTSPAISAAIHFSHLEPILRCNSIVHFHVTHPLPVVIRLEELEQLASAWPSLRSLVLSNNSLDHEELPDDPSWPHLDLRALTVLSRSCPYLEELRLRVTPDVGGGEPLNDDGPEKDIVPFKHLFSFRPGRQSPQGGDEQIIAIAMFLGQILPPGCEIRCDPDCTPGTPGMKGEEGWNEVKKGRRYIEEIHRIKGDKRWKQVTDKKDEAK